LARSANCSLWMLRRLTTTRRPRRTFSEIELIFKESTNVRAWGMRRSAKLVPLSRVGIFLSQFDSIAPYGRIARWRERVISGSF
jgi:hypothetical protein